MKRRRKRKKIIPFLILLVIVLVISISFQKIIANNVAEGKNQIAAESKPVEKVEEPKVETKPNQETEIKPVDKVEEKIQTAEKQDKKTENNVDKTVEKKNYKRLFSKDMFIGDSITDGLAYYELVNDQNVIAKLGVNLTKAKGQIGILGKKKPKNVYILFGANDIGGNMTVERFIQRYEELIHTVKEKSPNSHIYVQSILPISPKMEAKRPDLGSGRIKGFNDALIQMAYRENINYLNIASVLKNAKGDIHESDGIHFKYSFYPLWLNYLVNNVK